MGFPPRPFPLTMTHHPMFLHLLYLLSNPPIDPVFIGVQHHLPPDPLLQLPLDPPQILHHTEPNFRLLPLLTSVRTGGLSPSQVPLPLFLNPRLRPLPARLSPFSPACTYTSSTSTTPSSEIPRAYPEGPLVNFPHKTKNRFIIPTQFSRNLKGRLRLHLLQNVKHLLNREMMTVKNRPGQIVKIPPTLPTLILPSPFPSVTIRPDLQRTAIRALHPLLPSDLPQVFQAILPTWEKNLSDGFTIHGSPSPSDSLSPHYTPNLRSLEGMSLSVIQAYAPDAP
jgi:hypothetical protein